MAKSKKTSSKRKTAKRKNADKSQLRVIWGLIFLALTIISALSTVGTDGVLVDWYSTAVRGCIGYGSFAAPICFFAAAVIFFVKKSATLSRRVFCSVLLPMLTGTMAHIVICENTYSFSYDGVSKLFADGMNFNAGGVISGGIAEILSVGLSRIGAGIFCGAAIILCCVIAFHIDLFAFFDGIRSFFGGIKSFVSADYNYDDDELAENEKRLAEKAARKEKRNIDINIDGIGKKKAKNEKIIDVPLDEPEIVSNFSHLEPPPNNDVLNDETEDNPPWEEMTEEEFASLNEEETEQKKEVKEDKKSKESKNDDEQDITDEFIELDDEQDYSFPPISLLNLPISRTSNYQKELAANSSRLIDTLKSFNIDAQIINITHGPSVTRYELQLTRGTKFSKLTALSDDIALSLGAASVRIAPIPDKLAIGVEVPNQTVETVYIRDLIDSAEFKNAKSRVTFSVGKDISGSCVVGDIAKMPHMLIAGTTGSGKSVCINSLLISLLYKSSPHEVRLIMIDPKMIELGCYNGIPHLLIPVVTDPKKAASALNWAVSEMMHRYKLFSEHNVRDLASYNNVQKSIDGGQPLPQIVIVIDELADLMLVAAKQVEEAICRVAQMARAAGMHLIIATQRPSADVITGLMKANIPSRIAFAVASQIESRIILDTSGAEKLIGRGDMLYAPLGCGKPMRVQGCLISSEEVEKVVEHIKQTGEPDYSEEVIDHIEKNAAENEKKESGDTELDDADEMLDAAIEVVVETGQASVSFLQRRLKLGYSRAARIVDQMEERGIVGPFEGAKPRAVLITKELWLEMKTRKMP